MKLSDLKRALQVFACQQPTHWPNHFSLLLLAVAGHQGHPTFEELGEAVGLSNSSISRSIRALGATNRKGERGFGLVETFQDPDDGRRFKVQLTQRGQALIRQIELL